MAEAFGADRRAAVCRELTKTYEEVRRGGLAELADWAAEGVRGEITVVVGGAAARSRDRRGRARPAYRSGSPPASGSRTCAPTSPRQTGLSKKALYDAALAAR